MWEIRHLGYPSKKRLSWTKGDHVDSVCLRHDLQVLRAQRRAETRTARRTQTGAIRWISIVIVATDPSIYQDTLAT
ncbi:Hypothetical predicted protein [Scomber scombrus]|uniref:Uncharacterized protein n=1 Tax=Scomber scombrus TaxID=13677 RepID=A0AAV1NK02_SCOSC